MNLAVRLALVVPTTVSIHPPTPVTVGLYAALWYFLPEKVAGQITY